MVAGLDTIRSRWFGKDVSRGCEMTPVGFEPTQLALVELESTPLDHSGKVSILEVVQKGHCERVCQRPSLRHVRMSYRKKIVMEELRRMSVCPSG